MAPLLLKYSARLRCGLPALLLALCLSGCSSLFFYPMNNWVQNPALSGLSYEDVVLIHEDGTRISGWWLPADAPLRGTVYFLHGNAQNISTQMANVSWLPPLGFQVLLIDYQGFGLSEGEPSVETATSDIQLGLDWLQGSGRLAGQPLIVYAQSLGASMGIWTMAQEANQQSYSCLIEEAGFADYKAIVNDVMKRSWLLWPLRPMVLPFISNEYAADAAIANISPRAIMLIHSRDDEVVPLAEGEALFVAAQQPKEMLVTDGAHAAASRQSGVRDKMLSFMERRCGVMAPPLVGDRSSSDSDPKPSPDEVALPEQWKF